MYPIPRSLCPLARSICFLRRSMCTDIDLFSTMGAVHPILESLCLRTGFMNPNASRAGNNPLPPVHNPNASLLRYLHCLLSSACGNPQGYHLKTRLNPTTTSRSPSLSVPSFYIEALCLPENMMIRYDHAPRVTIVRVKYKTRVGNGHNPRPASHSNLISRCSPQQ